MQGQELHNGWLTLCSGISGSSPTQDENLCHVFWARWVTMACMGFAGQQHLVRKAHLVQAWTQLRTEYRLYEGMRACLRWQELLRDWLTLRADYPFRLRALTRALHWTWSKKHGFATICWDGSQWCVGASVDHNAFFFSGLPADASRLDGSLRTWCKWLRTIGWSNNSNMCRAPLMLLLRLVQCSRRWLPSVKLCGTIRDSQGPEGSSYPESLAWLTGGYNERGGCNEKDPPD